MFLALALCTLMAAKQADFPGADNPGQMYAIRGNAYIPMPLQRTSVDADVAGMGARVKVVQNFVNSSTVPIEAIYTFPLPHDAAVDSMRIAIGDRIISGKIMLRDQARQVYDAAKQNGQVAALLDQENDNIFTQSVANIMPGQKIQVEISYVQYIKFENGEFEFMFPMVVGPRYLGAGTPNPSEISPPMEPKGVRSGQTIGLHLTIHGGAPIVDYRSVLHKVVVDRIDDDTVHVDLAKAREIPNRDFIFRYRTAGEQVQESLATTWDDKTGGYFALTLAPPPKPMASERTPKEMVFVLDQSGSQAGFPIEKSKELCYHLLDTMGPNDTFNVMGFSNEVNPLWPGPRPNTPENQAEARAFIGTLYGNGGTELEKAIVASLSTPPDADRLRIVLFNTDGYAGQEPIILGDIQRYRGMSRLFTFGIGNSVNHSLIDAMSYEGRGSSQTVTLAERGSAAAQKFAQEMDEPLLVDIQAKFSGDAVDQVTPQFIPDVFSSKPVVIYGHYSHPGKTRLTISGLSGISRWTRTIDVNLPKGIGDGSEVASLWARRRIAELKSSSFTDQCFGKKSDVSQAITQIALEHNILSEFTSFVAVDSSISNRSRNGISVQVPVETPSGVSMPGTVNKAFSGANFGSGGRAASFAKSNAGLGGGFGGSGGFGGGGLGGGGFGGGAGQGYVPATNQAGQAHIRGASGIDQVSYDPTDNSLIVNGRLTAAQKPGVHSVNYAAGLLQAKKSVNIKVTVSELNDEVIRKLRKLGFTAESNDGVSIVFGSATPAALKQLAKLQFVVAVDWLHEER